jgi:hypothetical protein
MTYHLTQESSEIGLTVEPSSTAQIGLGKEKAAPRDQDTATDDRIVLPPPPGRIPAIVYADGSSPAPMSLPKLQGSVDAAAMRDFLTDRVLLDEDQCNRILEVMKSSETNVDLTASIPHVVNRALAADPTTDEARQSRATLQNAMRSGRVHPSEIADHVLTMVEDQPDLAVISGSAGPRSSGALQFVTTSSQGLTWRDIRMSTSDQERAIVATWADDHARGGLVAKGIIGGEETDRDSDLDTLRLLMGRPLTLEGRDSYMAIRSAQATPELQPIAVANYVSLQADALRQVDEGPVS